MELLMIYAYNKAPHVSHITVEEKPKTFKVLKCSGLGAGRAFVKKDELNKVIESYGSFKLFTDKPFDEARKLWDGAILEAHIRIEEEYKKKLTEIESYYVGDKSKEDLI